MCLVLCGTTQRNGTLLFYFLGGFKFISPGRYRVTALLLKLAMKLTPGDCGSGCHNVMCLQIDLDRWLNSVFVLSLSITP